MKRKQQAGVQREKTVPATGKPKKEKNKGQCIPGMCDQTTPHPEMEHCGRGRKKKNSFTLCNPGMEHRCQLALQTGHHPSQNTSHGCKNKCDRAKSSSRAFDFGNPINSGCTSPIQSKSDATGLSLPLSSSYNWGMTRPATFYQGDDRGVSAYESLLHREQTLMKSGDHDGEKSSAFSARGCRPPAYSSTNRPSVTGYTQTKYAPSNSTRSLAAIMAEYGQPQSKMDNITGSFFNTSSNGVSVKNPNYFSQNLSHNSSSLLGRPNSLHLSDSKSPASFGFNIPRPRSAGGYHTGSTKFTDYKDDMSTINFNAVRSDSTGRIGSTSFGYNSSSEGKSLASKFGMSGNAFGSNDIDSILKSFRPSVTSTKTPYYGTSSQQGLTSYRRKYDSSSSTNTNDVRYEFLPNRSNIGMLPAYDFRSRFVDTNSSDNFINRTMGSFTYDDSENDIPSSKQFSSFMGNPWQSEKDRLNKIANIIGKSTYGSYKKE